MKDREELFVDRKISFFRSVYLWWKFDGRYYHKTFIQGCKNLIKWFPTIWSDRDYDHDYIYHVLKFKLDKQARYLLSKNRFESTDKKVRDMSICIKLIDKITNDYYGLEYFEYLKHKYYSKISDYDNGTDEVFYELETETIEDNLDNYFKKYPLIYKSIKDKSDREKVAMKISDINNSRARDLLFKILRNNIDGWWD